MVPSRDDGVRQMRVLMVEPIGGHRGMHYYDFELCEALRQAGIDVTLLTCDETVQVSVPPLLRIGYPFQCIYGDLPKAVRGLHYVRGLISTLRTAKQQHAQIIHFHFPHIPVIDYLYLVLAKQLGVGIVLTVHDVIPFNAKSSDHRWLRRFYGQANRLVVHADDNRKHLIDKFDVKAGLVSAIPMGHYRTFATDNVLPVTEARRRLGLDCNSLVVLFFGQIKQVKGLGHLIRAFRQVVDVLPASHLVIAGPEWQHSFEPYRRLIEELELCNLTGKLPFLSMFSEIFDGR